LKEGEVSQKKGESKKDAKGVNRNRFLRNQQDVLGKEKGPFYYRGKEKKKTLRKKKLQSLRAALS